jgi:hypothetical protein
LSQHHGRLLVLVVSNVDLTSLADIIAHRYFIRTGMERISLCYSLPYYVSRYPRCFLLFRHFYIFTLWLQAFNFLLIFYFLFLSNSFSFFCSFNCSSSLCLLHNIPPSSLSVLEMPRSPKKLWQFLLTCPIWWQWKHSCGLLEFPYLNLIKCGNSRRLISDTSIVTVRIPFHYCCIVDWKTSASFCMSRMKKNKNFPMSGSQTEVQYLLI